MDLNVDQPIAALASPPGGAARGIVRISGIGVRETLAGWFQPDNAEAWGLARSPRSHSGVLRLENEDHPVTFPVQTLLWPNMRSYTGQPLIELHLPGSPCLLEAVLGEVYRHGARPARPGEFTMRAFLAGKVDLLQAEAVLGVIDASNHVELQTALVQLAGGVSGQLSHLRRNLLELLADLEAGLDFVDEDIEFVSRTEVVNRLSTARDFVGNLLKQTNDRMQSRIRSKVVLAGLPNAGKSTLFNRLAKSDKALVSSEQGTTRDFLTCAVTWHDLAFELIDTAGWDDCPTGIAAEAQAQRRAQLKQSDLLIWCSASDLNEVEQSLDDRWFHEAKLQASDTIRILTKVDLARVGSTRNETSYGQSSAESCDIIPISAVTNTGLAAFQASVRAHLSTDHHGSGQWLGTTAARCRETLESVVRSLGRAHEAASYQTGGDELIAVDLRDALDHLGTILGVIYTDDILDRIFSKFCIGK